MSGPLVGIGLKIAATVCFTIMSTIVKLVSPDIPTGEITFCRGFFALIPVLCWTLATGQFPGALGTKNPLGHLTRATIGTSAMVLGFAGLARLPLADATAIGYATPLMTVILAVLSLKETVGPYRWSAVVVGLAGVLLMIAGYAAPSSADAPHNVFGALLALTGTVFAALATIQIRRLHRTERSAAIVVYFSLFTAAAGLLTLPLGWQVPDVRVAGLLVALGVLGGLGQVLMTEGLRHANVSVLAPFDYLTLIWAIAIGYLVFGTLPTVAMLVGSAIVIGAGLFVVYRESVLKVPPHSSGVGEV